MLKRDYNTLNHGHVGTVQGVASYGKDRKPGFQNLVNGLMLLLEKDLPFYRSAGR